MNRKEPTKTFMMILNQIENNLLVSMVFNKNEAL